MHRALSFAEIPDGRVSRLHCIVRADGPPAAPAQDPVGLASPAGTPRGARDAADADEAALESLLRELCRLDSRLAASPNPKPSPAAPPAAYLEDFSSNGTFLNGERVPAGAAVPLRDGDRLSLVLSVAPLMEQFFTFHQGARVQGAILPGSVTRARGEQL